MPTPIGARLFVFSPKGNPALSTFTALEVSPRWDMRAVGKPYYEIDNMHSTGASDA